MTDSTKMVDLPWVDGTTRTVPEETPYVMRDGYLAYARDGGYSYAGGAGRILHDHDDDSAAVRIFAEAPEPPVKVDVPTKIAAVVSLATRPDLPGYVLTREGWRGLSSHWVYEASVVAEALRGGAVVLYEGVDE
ncbi:hypothetical protein [Escherichia coli]|uniref:hypothetical protein n=1 Tax=Escherichia coli TaxID=562 RepID=UPI00312CA959